MPVEVLQGIDKFRDIINGDKPVVIDFWAPWCGPCRFISPILDKMSEDPAYSGVGFYKVDVDDEPDISKEVGIKAMPTFQVYAKGNKVQELVGANQDGLKNLLTAANALV